MREKGIVIAMEYVIHAFGLTDFEAFLLILAWASQMDHETGLAVSAMCEYQGEKGPTIHFCARLYALEEAETIEIKRKCLCKKRTAFLAVCRDGSRPERGITSGKRTSSG